MSKLESLDLIKKLDNKLFEKFCNQIIDRYLNPQKNENFNFLLPANDNDATIDLKKVFKEWFVFIVKFFDSEKDELALIDDLDDDKKEILIKIIEQKNELIKRFLFYMAIEKDYPNLVNEFDWNINLVLATDQISNLNKPLVNLQFNNSKNETICNLELNEDELDQLLEVVDNASNELKDLLT